jgi:hypothetical protein
MKKLEAIIQPFKLDARPDVNRRERNDDYGRAWARKAEGRPRPAKSEPERSLYRILGKIRIRNEEREETTL